MICPACGSVHIHVIDRNVRNNAIVRRRRCKDCAHRFTTYETTVRPTELVRAPPSEKDRVNYLRCKARRVAAATGGDYRALCETYGVPIVRFRTPETNDRIRGLRRQGWLLKQIAAEVGCSLSYASSVCKAVQADDKAA